MRVHCYTCRDVAKTGVNGNSFLVKIIKILSDCCAHPGYAWQEIVNISSHMELQHLEVLQYDMKGSAVLLIPSKLLVGFDDVTQFTSQIILHTQ